jgi:hypothetical protein
MSPKTIWAPSTRPSFSTAIALAVLLASGTWVHAAPPKGPDSIPHLVVQGETLEKLASLYFGDTRLWTQLQAANQIPDPRRLQPGSTILIPARLLPVTSGTVEFVRGNVTVAQAGNPGTTAPAQAGQQLDEGARIQSGPDSFVAVRLADGTIVRVHAQSDVQLRQMRRRGRAGSLQSILEMQSGSLDTSVPDQGEILRRFEIRTPSASTSVRGTRFDVTIAPSGQLSTAVLEGSVAVRSLNAPAHSKGELVNNGQGVLVSAAGDVGTPKALLPAPDLSALPSAVHDPALLTLPLPALGSASAWQVQISQDSAATQVLRQGIFNAAQAAWQSIDDGAYHVTVRGLDADGIPGYAAHRPLVVKTRPVPPLAQSPAPGAILAQGQGELLCTEVPGVRWYHLQVARDAKYQDVVLAADRQNECRLGLESLPMGTYHWRAASILAKADNAPDQGPFSSSQAFTIANRPASLQSMEAQDGVPNASLHWNADPGQTFRLMLARDIDFKEVVEDVALEHPRWEAQALPGGIYYVRIQVIAASGLKSDFSQPRKITISASIQDGFGNPLRTTTGTPIQSP